MTPRDFRQDPPTNALRSYDVIIIGAGAAGCAAAISLAPLKVALVSSVSLSGASSSLWSQGGIAAVVQEEKDDSVALHTQDTCAVGDGLTDKPTAQFFTEAAESCIQFLENCEMVFDRTVEGGFDLSKEGGHSAARVLKALSSDGFGRSLMPTLISQIQKSDHIDVIENYTLCDLLQDQKDTVIGVGCLETKGQKNLTLFAPNIVLATGGAAALYARTTNPMHNVGSGIAIAARAGAALIDLEFMQFHPTSLNVDVKDGQPQPLLTEALRGHGARLINSDSQYFMNEYHDLADLAPRDHVSRAVFDQQSQNKDVFLDCRHIDVSAFKTLQMSAKGYGFNPKKDVLPITPAAHYFMGGVKTDVSGRTSVQGLWAIGEVASTGLHGANRLASNSLLEAIVMGQTLGRLLRCGAPSRGSRTATIHHEFYVSRARGVISAIEKTKIFKALRDVMSEYVGVVRQAKKLHEALDFFKSIERDYRGLDFEIEDRVLMCKMITQAALNRKESRGGHYRADFPKKMVQFRKRETVVLKQDQRANKIQKEKVIA